MIFLANVYKIEIVKRMNIKIANKICVLSVKLINVRDVRVKINVRTVMMTMILTIKDNV